MNNNLVEHDKLRQVIREMNVMDDDFFNKVAEDKAVCEEILQTIIGDESLKLHSAETQKFIRNCGSRSVCIDVLCTAEDGRKFGIEVQKKDNDDHQRRVRYEGSNIDTLLTEKGLRFEEIPEVYIIYIAKFDIFREGRELYHVIRIVEESEERVHNGFHEIYMNVQAESDTKIGKLAKYMVNTKGDCPEFPQLTRRVKYLKEENGGMVTMSKAWKDLAKEYAERYVDSIRDDLREKVKAEVKEEVKAEVKEEVKAQVTADIKVQVVKEVTEDVKKKTAEENAKNFLENGVSLEIVAACIKDITMERIKEIYASVKLKAVQ